MSTLSKELDRYLTIRRSLGYHLSTAERILRRFIAFAERADAEYISTALFLRWQEASGMRVGKHGRASWEWFGSSPNGYTAWTQNTRYRRRR